MIKESSDFISKVKVSYHPANVGDHRQSDSGYIMVFVCHVTLQDHVIKAFLTLWFGAPQDKFPPYQVGRADMFLVCHAIS